MVFSMMLCCVLMVLDGVEFVAMCHMRMMRCCMVIAGMMRLVRGMVMVRCRF
jgi:hypothetical protein